MELIICIASVCAVILAYSKCECMYIVYVVYRVHAV